jgi:hypothetical protein
MIAYLQSVNYHHIEIMYKLLARNGPYHFSVYSCYFHTSKYETYFSPFYKYCNKNSNYVHVYMNIIAVLL